MTIKHVVSVSSGKDSDSTLLIALDRFDKKNVIPIFCDTGNEHEEVYRHLDYLELALDIKITRLKASFDERIKHKRMFIARDQRIGRDKSGKKLRWSNKSKRRALAFLMPTGNPYLDLCMWKGRFPSRKAQFCTEELKTNLAVTFQLDLADQGFTVVSWQGIRRDESLKRKDALMFERIAPSMYIYRPIVEWTAAMTFESIAAHGLVPNALYKQGMGRVGCMPCINARKAEISEIAKRFPLHMKRIEIWEWYVMMCSKRQVATFFPALEIKNFLNKQQAAKDHGIWSVVEWAKTTRGGKQYDLLAEVEDTHACSSSYGLCE